MRYYNIVITDATTGAVVKQYSSLNASGTTNPGALQVEMDIPVSAFAVPISQAFIRVHGISLADISQASNLNGMTCAVYGGMAVGLPLANPAQAGLLTQGTIFQAFGNWLGTDMTLDLILVTDGGTADAPKNLVLNWKAGTPLGDAVANCLTTAFPTYAAPVVSASSSLVRATDETSMYQSVEQLAADVKLFSQDINKIPGYNGLDINIKQNQFVITDGSASSTPKVIQFTDLIGQPTWFQSGVIQFNCVMRADLVMSDVITMPTTVVTTLAASQPQARDKSAFQGNFAINLIRHVGNFRQPDAQSWITTFNAYQQVDQ